MSGPLSHLNACEGYGVLGMWEAAWEELEALPDELRSTLPVLGWRVKILLALGEPQKASFIAVSLVGQFPKLPEVRGLMACSWELAGSWVVCRVVVLCN